jgi:hypothetical protein
MPEVAEAPLADLDETRNAFQASPLSTAVRQLESQLQAAADDGELVVAVTDPGAAFCGRTAARSCGARHKR